MAFQIRTMFSMDPKKYIDRQATRQRRRAEMQGEAIRQVMTYDTNLSRRERRQKARDQAADWFRQSQEQSRKKQS